MIGNSMIVQKTNAVKRFHSLLLRTGLTLLLGAAFLPGLYATHIVGGQIGYRWISDSPRQMKAGKAWEFVNHLG